MLHRINIEPAQTTLVPQKYFRPEWVNRLAALNFRFDPRAQIALPEMHKNIVFLSVVDKKTYEMAMRAFPSGGFTGVCCLLYQTFEKLTHSEKRDRYRIFARIAPKTFDLFVFEKHHLIFVNTFPIQTLKDLLYYLLHVVNRLKIDTGGLTLRIIDSTSDSKLVIQALEPYFLSVVKLSDKEHPLSFRVPIQGGFSLINAALCESSVVF